jgi:hypothetical protein
VEPLTAITLIATKYGVSALIGALSGNKDLGALASELVGTLVASEDRLGERLGTIGRQLEEVLEQRYSTAIAAGQRTLLDAGTTLDPSMRSAELTRARDLFRDAAASARAPLQVAVAERYMVLCAIALGREDAARTALGLLNRSAFEALLGALSLTGPEAVNRARAQVSAAGFRTWREDRIDELSRTIINAAAPRPEPVQGVPRPRRRARPEHRARAARGIAVARTGPARAAGQARAGGHPAGLGGTVAVRATVRDLGR